jgi:hypothetical protein
MAPIPFRLIFLVLFDDGSGIESRLKETFPTFQACMEYREKAIPPLKTKMENDPLIKDHIELIDGICIREDELEDLNKTMQEQARQPKIKI